MPEVELFLLFVRPLNQLGVRYFVSGSVASIIYGEPRLTHGVDFVVFLKSEEIPRLHHRAMLELSGEMLNHAELRDWASRCGVEEEWRKVGGSDN